MSIAINGTDGITYNDGSLQASAPVGKNLIINGDMTIDQLDMQYHDAVNGTTTWKDHITAVKNANPKP